MTEKTIIILVKTIITCVTWIIPKAQAAPTGEQISPAVTHVMKEFCRPGIDWTPNPNRQFSAAGVSPAIIATTKEYMRWK